MIDEAVILIAGMGTRLLPYTKTIPKELLPIYDVPSILLLVEEAYNSGIKKIIFVVTEHNQDLIKNFFSNDKYLNEFLKDKPDKKIKLKRINNIINNMKFSYVLQDLKGTYGALYSAKKYIKNDNFIVMYGDDLIDSKEPITKKLIDSYSKNHLQQVLVYKEHNLPNVGIALIKNNKLVDLVPKSETNSKYVIHGRMLLNKKIFSIKDKMYKHENDEYYLPYALLYFNDINTIKYDKYYFNIGDKTGYIKASIHYAIKDNNKDLKEYINSIKEVK